MNTINPEEYLKDKGFVLKGTLDHNNLTDFIIPWFKKKNIFTVFFRALNFILLIILGAFIGYVVADGSFNLGFVWQFLAGVAAVLLIVPLHEYLHGLAYKVTGAKDVRYKVLWRDMIFYALAQNFIADYKAFRLIALAPFLVINSVLIILMFVTGFQWIVFFLGILLMHTLCCVGDFSLLSYMYEHRKQDVHTFDDTEKGESYFYVREETVAG